jgi:hypothetical protein
MPDELARAQLRRVAADLLVMRVGGWQAHGGPDLHRAPRNAVPTVHIILIGVVFEQVELDHLDALVLEIDQGSIETALIAREVAEEQRSRARRRVAGAPVVRPVHPRRGAVRERTIAAAAQGRVLANLAEESVLALVGDLADGRRREQRARAQRRHLFPSIGRYGEDEGGKNDNDKNGTDRGAFDPRAHRSASWGVAGDGATSRREPRVRRLDDNAPRWWKPPSVFRAILGGRVASELDGQTMRFSSR